MSTHSSDSEDNWTLVQPHLAHLKQNPEDSSASSDFVDLEEDVVRFHHRQHSTSREEEAQLDADQSAQGQDGTAVDHEEGPSRGPALLGLSLEQLEAGQTDGSSSPSSSSESDKEDPSSVSSSSAASISALSSSIEELSVPDDDCVDTVELGQQQQQQQQLRGDSSSSSSSSSSASPASSASSFEVLMAAAERDAKSARDVRPKERAALKQGEKGADLIATQATEESIQVPAVSSATTATTAAAASISSDHQRVKEHLKCSASLDQRDGSDDDDDDDDDEDEEEEDGDGEGGAVGGGGVAAAAQVLGLGWEVLAPNPRHPPPAIIGQLRLRRQISDSESDHSDFVRLDAAMAEEVDPLMPEALQDVMQVSHSSGSSIGAGFRFVHPSPQGRYYEDDEDSIPSDVDDRCESDISGVAADESDLSAVSCELVDLDLTSGNVVRSYKHRPNQSLNALLSTIALLTLFLAIGVGVGHYIGSVREARLGAQQVLQMKSLQDDYLLCLRQQQIVETRLHAEPTFEERLGAVTSVWRQKYEELIIEKADLEQRIKKLESERVMDLGGVQKQVSSHRAEIEELQEELRLLHSDTSVLQSSHQEQVSLMEQITEQEALITRQHYEITTNQQLAESLRKEVEQAQDQVAELARERTAEAEQRLNLEEELKDLRLRYEKLKAEYQDGKEEYGAMVKELTTRVDNLMLDIDSKSEAHAAIGAELIALKEELNQLRLENTDLRDEVSRLRYTEHPANARVHAEVKEHALKNRVNELANENEALKSTVGKLRYTPHPGNDYLEEGTEDVKTSDSEPVTPLQVLRLKARLASVNTQLEAEKNRSEMLRLLLLEQEKASSDRNEPSFLGCLSHLVLQLNLSDNSIFETVSEGAQHQWEFLQKLSNDSDFVASFRNQWHHLRDDCVHMAGEAKQVLGDIQASIASKWKEYARWSSDNQSKDRADNTSRTSTFSTLRDTVQNLTQSDKLNQVLTKTKETVSQLTEKIQDTWHQVKNLSADFLDRHPTVKKMGEKVQKMGEKVQKVGEKVGEKMQKVGRNVQRLGRKASEKIDKLSKKVQQEMEGMRSGSWFQGETETDMDTESCSQEVEHETCKTSDEPQPAFGPTRRRANMEPLNSADIDDSLSQNHKKQFEVRNPHKQSSSQEYEEFWKLSEFNPDDIIHEGFFEGNNREWRKQQKRLRKLHGRIQRLNDDILNSLDDDDLDDIYDDLEDFEDDIEDEPQPVRLKTWLTCQSRWWKSRLHRKHRTEDLVKGCGRHLMKWQMRALCKPRACHNKKCRKQAERELSGPFCTTFNAVINAQGECNLHDKDCRKENQESFQGFLVDNVPNAANKQTSVIQGADPSQPDNAKWYFEMAQDRDNRRHDPLWYVRAIDEQAHPWIPGQGLDSDAKWVFDRAAERDFERTKPWYFKRAEDRERHHQPYGDFPDPGDAKWGRD